MYFPPVLTFCRRPNRPLSVRDIFRVWASVSSTYRRIRVESCVTKREGLIMVLMLGDSLEPRCKDDASLGHLSAIATKILCSHTRHLSTLYQWFSNFFSFQVFESVHISVHSQSLQTCKRLFGTPSRKPEGIPVPYFGNHSCSLYWPMSIRWWCNSLYPNPNPSPPHLFLFLKNRRVYSCFSIAVILFMDQNDENKNNPKF